VLRIPRGVKMAIAYPLGIILGVFLAIVSLGRNIRAIVTPDFYSLAFQTAFATLPGIIFTGAVAIITLGLSKRPRASIFAPLFLGAFWGFDVILLLFACLESMG
jgi:hypothetical protein